MLRASSLGLNLPSPTIFALQPCRRLCGARTRWVYAHSASSSASTRTTAGPLFPCPNPNTITSTDAGETLRVTGALVLSEVGHVTAAKSSLDVSLKFVGATHGIGSSPATEAMPVTPDLRDENRNFSQKDSDKWEEEQEQTISDPHCSVALIQPAQRIEHLRYQSGGVKPVNMPKYLLTPLRRLREEANIVHKQFRLALSPETSASVGESTITKKPPPQDMRAEMEKHLNTLGKSPSVDDAWNAYVFLIDLIASNHLVHKHIRHIPFSHLHRLARLLANNAPKTHRQFLRLLAVLTYLKHCGGNIQQHEWNALVDHAGKGWRKTRQEDFTNAMNVFNDMRAGRLPGSWDLLPPDVEVLEEGPSVEPDIYTYTSLLSIAARAMDGQALRNISTLMSNAGLAPNRITHLALLRYFTLQKNLGGVRATLLKMRQQDLTLGMDGLNACMWAFGNNGRLDIVMLIYQLLRHNMLPETYRGAGDITEVAGQLGEEFIFVEPEMKPDLATYTTVVQTMAYRGHFDPCVNVFMDMLTFDNTGNDVPLKAEEATLPTPSTGTMPIFRAFFLGFSRHAVSPSKHTKRSTWTLKNLRQIFDLFLSLPEDSNPSHTTIYLIMVAFDNASGHDIDLLRNVWNAVDRRFGIPFHKPKSESRLVKIKQRLFPNDKAKPG